MKKWCLPVLCFSVLLAIFTITAAAETEGIFTYSVIDGNAAVTKVDYTGLTEVTVPETLGGCPVTTLGPFAFQDNDDLPDGEVDNVYLPKTVTAIDENAFVLSDIKHIYVDEENPAFTSDENGVVFSKDMTTLVRMGCTFAPGTFTVPETVTAIRDRAFEDCVELERIVFPDGLKSIGDMAFYQAIILTDVSLPAGVSVGQNAFAFCEALKEVRTDGAAVIKGSAFTECSALERVVLSEGTEYLDMYAFENDQALKCVYLPKSLQTVGIGAFGNCLSLTDVCYAGTEEEWADISIDTNAYYGSRPVVIDRCTIHCRISAADGLAANHTLENGVLSISGSGALTNVWHYWDAEKDNVTALTVGDGIEGIGENAFTDFPALTDVICSGSVTLASGAFSNCTTLKNVVLFGDSTLSPEAFRNCEEIPTVFSDGERAFSGTETGVNHVVLTYQNGVLRINGSLTMNAYDFFDLISVFCAHYGEITKVRVENFRFDGITVYYFDASTGKRRAIPDALAEGEIYPQLETADAPEAVSFNTLVDGIGDGSVTHFYLVINDEAHPDTEITRVSIVDSIKEGFQRILRAIVTLLNKLFNLIKNFGK